MGISSRVAVAGAAGLFGLVIAAGGAIAASGATLVADAPGTVLRVQGIGEAPATEIGKTARLNLLALAAKDGSIETVLPAAAISLRTAPADSTDQTSDTVPNTGDPTRNTGTHVPGTGNGGIAGNGNTSNGKGNAGISGNGNTDNGHGSQGLRGNSANPGEPGDDKPGRGDQEEMPSPRSVNVGGQNVGGQNVGSQNVGSQNASDSGNAHGNPGQPGPAKDHPTKGPRQ
ncbi:hypothetical protein [Parafrigoribacterium humi]|uniref:hypothetical protein n=1 Tax=Parafrigoribacterium humi TaxID=3144664 RepID=UPI0032EE0D85